MSRQNRPRRRWPSWAERPGGPLVFLGIYAGAALLHWKHDAKQAEEAKAKCRDLLGALGRLEQGLLDQKELAGLLDEMLRRDSEMREQLERAEREHATQHAAAEAVVKGVLDDLGVEVQEGFESVRIYLTNISTWVVEGFERVEAKQAVTHAKLDANAELLARAVALLEARESVPAQVAAGSDALPERPPLSDEDKAIFEAAKPSADALTRYRIAVAEGDDAEAERLEAEVERLLAARRADEDFVFQRARGDRHFYAGRYDEAVGPYRAALALRPDDAGVANDLAAALLRARHNADHGAALAEAEGLLARALELRRAEHPGDHPDIAMSLNNLAYVRGMLGRWAEALGPSEQAVAMAARCLP